MKFSPLITIVIWKGHIGEFKLFYINKLVWVKGIRGNSNEKLEVSRGGIIINQVLYIKNTNLNSSKLLIGLISIYSMQWVIR